MCLNTDDRGMWDSNMTDEYNTAMTTFNLSWGELTQLARYSLQHAFIEAPVKEKLLKSYEDRLNAFTNRYSKGTIEQALDRLKAADPVTYGYAFRTWGLRFD